MDSMKGARQYKGILVKKTLQCSLVVAIIVMITAVSTYQGRNVVAHADFEFEGVEFKLRNKASPKSQITNTRLDTVRVRISKEDDLWQFIIIPPGQTRAVPPFHKLFRYDIAIHDAEDRMLFFRDDYKPEWGFRIYNKPKVKQVSEPAGATTTTWFGVKN